MGSTLAAFKSRFQNRPRNDREQTDVKLLTHTTLIALVTNTSRWLIFKAGDGLHKVMSSSSRIAGSKALPIGNKLPRFLLLQESTA